MAFLEEATTLINTLGKSANRVRAPDPALAHRRELVKMLGARASELAELYARCDGLSLPDVGNGCFLYSASAILNGVKNGEVVRISGADPISVVVFGSDARGGRLALCIDSGEILFLAPGVVRLGVYESATPPRVVAASSAQFLDRLIDDLRAAAAGDARHEFLL